MSTSSSSNKIGFKEKLIGHVILAALVFVTSVVIGGAVGFFTPLIDVIGGLQYGAAAGVAIYVISLAFVVRVSLKDRKARQASNF